MAPKNCGKTHILISSNELSESLSVKCGQTVRPVREGQRENKKDVTALTVPLHVSKCGAKLIGWKLKELGWSVKLGCLIIYPEYRANSFVSTGSMYWKVKWFVILI
jgi:hypothetical protein